MTFYTAKTIDNIADAIIVHYSVAIKTWPYYQH